MFKNDYERRVKMFDALLGSVTLYGAEVWGWRNEARLDRIKRKYIMDFRFRQSDSELYRNRRDEDERNKDRSSEESCKI